MTQGARSARITGLSASIVTGVVVAYLVALMFADYLSSWLPSAGGFPVGAIIRDGLAISVVLLGGAALISVRPTIPDDTRAAVRTSLRIALIAAVLAAVGLLVLVLSSDHVVAAFLAVRNLTLFPAAGVALWILIARRWLAGSPIATAAWVLITVAAILGIVDTLSSGRAMIALGYDRLFMGDHGVGLITGVDGGVVGIVRASGGITNALAFGYMMMAASLTAAWTAAQTRRASDRSWVVYAGIASITAAAGAASLTRGALIALVLAAAALVILSRRRDVAAAAGGIVLAAAIASVLIPLAAQGISNLGTGSGGGEAGGPPIVARFNESDAASRASSELRWQQLGIAIELIRDKPLGLGLAAVGSAALHVREGMPIVTDFYWLMVPIQVGLIVATLLAIAALAVFAAAWLSHRAVRPILTSIALLVVVAGTLSGAPDTPVFAGYVVTLAVLAMTWPWKRGQRLEVVTADRMVERRLPEGA